VASLCACLQLVRDLQGHYPAGTYTVLYHGDGVLEFSMDDVQAVRRLMPGFIEVDLVPTTGLNNGLYIRIERTNPLVRSSLPYDCGGKRASDVEGVFRSTMLMCRIRSAISAS